MSSLFNCIKLIINAWYGQNEVSNKTIDESMDTQSLSITKTETLIIEPSKDVLESQNNIIINEMLASLSVLEEKEATVIKKHRAMRHGNKFIRRLSEVFELPSYERGTIEFLDISEGDIIPPPEPPPQRPPQPPPKPPPKPPPVRPASPKLTQRDQRRANIITEIINSEKEYVKNLRDIHEGYYKQCQKTKDLFPHARLKTLFSNIGDIYKMHKKLLQSLEKKYKTKQPHLSEFGSCFLDQNKGFLLYAEYCKNHVNALEEWARLIVVEKYAYFFEVCRLHQQMMSLPLDGFLIMPVQKICKYPLLLMELLKATLPEHKDYRNVEAAVVAMKSVLNAINIEKGEDEIEDKILKFQKSILDWQGEDLSVISTQLIQRGDLIVVLRPHVRAKHFMAFLLDHQMILCKKDLLRRNMLYYKERIDIDQNIVVDVEDGREEEFDCKVKNAIKFKSKFDDEPSKLLFTKSLADKQLWLHAFEEERKISEGERDAEDTCYYDFPALNISTVTQEQLSFLAQPNRRKSSFWRKFQHNRSINKA